MKPTLDLTRAPVLLAKFFPTITREEAIRHFEEIGAAADEFGSIGVVVDLSEAPFAPASLRKVAVHEMRALFRRRGDRVAGVAHVVKTRTARALLGVMQSLAPPPFPSVVVATIDEARAWVEDRLDGIGDGARSVRRASLGPPQSFDARAATGLARTLVDAARARGIDVASELTRSHLTLADLSTVEGYVPYRTLMWLVEALAERTGDDAFGLHTAEDFVDASSFGVVGFAARSSTTLREAIDRTVRYATVINENTQMSVAYHGDGARIVDGPMPPLLWPRHYAELSLASFITLSRKWTGVRFDARAVGFRHRAPDDVREHRRIFGCVPMFDHSENFVVIPNQVLDTELEHGDRLLGEFFEGRLNELARTRGAPLGGLAEVREAMSTLLSEGAPTLASVGRKLGLSERTLQRRLGERGVTFSEVLDSVRRETAIRVIDRPNASVQELAFASGFSDVKAFRRAFHRWTGVAPREYRRGAKGDPTE